MEDHNSKLLERQTVLRNTVPSKLIPSIVFFSRMAVADVRNSVESTHVKKLANLSSEQQRPLFEVYNTVKVIDIDFQIPEYVLETLSLGPKNAVVESFDSKEVLTQMDSLLYRCKRDGITSEVMNSINVATFNYVKVCSKQKTPRYLSMTKKYLKDKDLLAIPFDKGIGICLMKKETYEAKMADLLKLD